MSHLETGLFGRRGVNMDTIEPNIPANVADLQVIYEQCNEHLREGDRKRDQILAFFTTLLGIFIGSSEQILEGLGNQEILLSVLHGIFFIGGCFLAFVLIEYRLWHLKYTLSGQVIQKLMFMSKATATKTDINEILRDSFSYKPNKIKLIKTTESMILNLFLVINFINVIYILYGSIKGIKGVITICTLLIVYLLYFNEKNYQSILKFYESVQEGKIPVWILDLIHDGVEDQKEDNIVYKNKYYEIEVNNNIPRIYDQLGGVVVVPITIDGKILLIQSERPLVNKKSWEFPRGFKEEGEDAEVAGARELKEETGLTAQTYTCIGSVCPNNGLLSSEIDIVLAEGIILENINLQDEEGIIDKKCLTIEELKVQAKTEITDGFTLSAMTKLPGKN